MALVSWSACGGGLRSSDRHDLEKHRDAARAQPDDNDAVAQFASRLSLHLAAGSLPPEVARERYLGEALGLLDRALARTDSLDARQRYRLMSQKANLLGWVGETEAALVVLRDVLPITDLPSITVSAFVRFASVDSRDAIIDFCRLALVRAAEVADQFAEPQAGRFSIIDQCEEKLGDASWLEPAEVSFLHAERARREANRRQARANEEDAEDIRACRDECFRREERCLERDGKSHSRCHDQRVECEAGCEQDPLSPLFGPDL